jgi:ribosomal protein S18 acetylase RimI-like enzyme
LRAFHHSCPVTEAERLHEALRTAFERLCSLFGDARFERREGYDLMAFPPIPIAQFNGVWPLDDGAAPMLSAALAELEELGLPSSVQVRRGHTPAFAAEAKRLGFTNELELPGMAARAGDLPSPQPNGLTLTRVSGGRDLDDALATAAGGFGAPASSMAPLYMPAVLAAEGFSLYLGRVDGMPVSTSVGLTVGDTLGIFNVATPPEHRGRGYGAALTAEAARAGFANGADLAWLQSSAMGHSVYERLGFRDVETYALLTR